MFSNTAYEALYQYLGLAIHGQFIEAITSEIFFKAMVLIIFGGIFFITVIKFFSRYMPSALVARKHIPLSNFAKIIFCLFMPNQIDGLKVNFFCLSQHRLPQGQ